jgi:hypothetical protein
MTGEKQETPPTPSISEKEPAEGSREVIDRELERKTGERQEPDEDSGKV